MTLTRPGSRSARTAWRAALAPLLLASVLAGIGSADTAPGDGAKLVQSVIDALKKPDVAGAVAKLEAGPEIDGLSARPDLVHVLCDRAYRYDSVDSDAAARQKLAARLVRLASATIEKAPNDDKARWAMAESLVLRERAGPKTGPEPWTQAADLLEKVHAGHPADALPLVYAVGMLLEASYAEQDQILQLTGRAETLAKKALDAQKDSPTIAMAVASSQFWAARTLITANRKYARTDLKDSLDSLKAFALKDLPQLDVATAWNDQVSFGKSNGFVLPERFVTSSRTTLDQSLTFDLPVSSKWTFTQIASTETTPGYDYVTEVGADGKRRRQVLFRRYAWNQKYLFEGSNYIGGDNVKSIAQGLLAMTAARSFAPGVQQSAPSRKPFCKELDGFTFDVKGKTQGEGSEAVHVFAYVVRGRNQACYAVLVYCFDKDDEPGPEMENLVMSLREPDK
jgi:hypothetical protein